MTGAALATRLDTATPIFAQRLQSFMQEHLGQPVHLSPLRRYPAGMSWITLGFTASAEQEHDLILRLGDPAGLFAPYSAQQQFQALRVLADVAQLPLPRAHAFSDDAAILGAPFIIIERVDGATSTPWARGADPAAPANIALGIEFADALAALHRFDWARSPLAGWSAQISPANSASRQVNEWAERAGLAAGPLPPQMHYAYRWLLANAPLAERISVVHGDYRVGNFLVHQQEISAILDWEFVHLGDPHEDLAWTALRTFAAGTDRIGGLFERAAFYRRYSEQSGFAIRPDLLRYYEVLAQFKSAAILLCATQRVASGRSQDVRMGAMGLQLAPTLLELNRLIAVA
jgi:aminoglycoside phosphotransferase (APT) family kinase protein